MSAQERKARSQSTKPSQGSDWQGFAPPFSLWPDKVEDFRRYWANYSNTVDKLLDDVELILSERQHKISLSFEVDKDMYWLSVTSKFSGSPSFGYTMQIKADSAIHCLALYAFSMAYQWPKDDWGSDGTKQLSYLFR